MNDLTKASPPVPYCGLRLSAGLVAAARDAETIHSFSNLPIITPDEVTEARAAIARLEARLAKVAEPDDIEAAVATLSTIYPAARCSDAEAEMRLALYVRLLADVPANALATAIENAAKVCVFFPTVAEIRREVNKLTAPTRRTIARLNYLIFKHQQDYRPEPTDICDPQDARRMIEEATGGLARRGRKARQRPGSAVVE